MSVVVVGMEIPSTCEECRIRIEVGSDMHCPLFVGSQLQDFGRKSECGFDDRPNWCPLRPLPENHGRLADLDAIIRELRSGKSETEEGYDGAKKPGSSLVLELLIGYLDGRPTIVEAEGEDA